MIIKSLPILGFKTFILFLISKVKIQELGTVQEFKVIVSFLLLLGTWRVSLKTFISSQNLWEKKEVICTVNNVIFPFALIYYFMQRPANIAFISQW